MDFSFSDEQNAIRDLAAQIFSDHASDEALQQFSRGDATYDDALWQVLADQGLLGIALPEAAGGSGLGLVELCLVLEEQGRRVAPVPMFSTLVLGALPIMEFAPEPLAGEWLPKVASGAARLSAAIAEMNMNPALRVPVSLAKEGDQWVLSGTRSMVPDGATADAILVPAADADGNKTLFLVPTDTPGVTLTPVEVSLSGQRAAHLSLENVALSDSHILGEVGQGGEIVGWLEQRADVAHCALQVGVTEEAMKRTAAYLSEREQFGRPLGSFQALAMRMADSYIDVEAIRSTYWLALWRLSEGLDARAEVRAAKWWACEAAHRVVCSAQHLHGGIGADLDYPIHRFFL
ncbi:MAG: acyl-CoA dehydrogenase family protein, partial [Halieaceae bacterium]|nr:acyl-CoA dehydrogenase family protein [Halieaceae bacterium]